MHFCWWVSEVVTVSQESDENQCRFLWTLFMDMNSFDVPLHPAIYPHSSFCTLGSTSLSDLCSLPQKTLLVPLLVSFPFSSLFSSSVFHLWALDPFEFHIPLLLLAWVVGFVFVWLQDNWKVFHWNCNVPMLPAGFSFLATYCSTLQSSYKPLPWLIYWAATSCLLLCQIWK